MLTGVNQLQVSGGGPGAVTQQAENANANTGASTKNGVRFL